MVLPQKTNVFRQIGEVGGTNKSESRSRASGGGSFQSMFVLLRAKCLALRRF